MSMDNMKSARNKPFDGSNVDVNDEVQKLFRRGDNNKFTNNFSKLKNKYDDTTYEKIQKKFMERHHLVSKKAKKFATLIREKYGLEQYPYHVLLEYSKLFKSKYGLTEEEFAEFQRLYENDLLGVKSPDIIPVSTNLTKVLGTISMDVPGFTYKLNDADYKHLQEILKLNATTNQLHAQVVMQSLSYKDCGYEALSGVYKKELGHRPGDSVHPVIAALFLPKINVLESHFIHSNLSRIVKFRYNSEPITLRSDYELIYSLTSDPNDIVCDTRSVLLDLLNRTQIQSQLWNSVLHLRNGQYYNTAFREFVGAIDMCRMNKQDTPDFIYGRYDGTILKRLLSAFSFRPTVVYTQPIYKNMISINPYQQAVRPVVSHIPMINFRLPPTADEDDNPSLDKALSQEQLVIQNGVGVYRSTNIIYSRDVLFFYIDRKTNTLRLNDLQPFNISRLPLTVSGLERLNTLRVNVPLELKVKDTTFFLKSAVVSNINNDLSEKNIVVGSSAIIYDNEGMDLGVETPVCYLYNPTRTSYLNTITNTIEDSPPLHMIPAEAPHLGSNDINAKDLIETRGVILMYTANRLSTGLTMQDVNF